MPPLQRSRTTCRVALLLTLALLSTAVLATSPEPLVHTRLGSVRGIVEDNGVVAFKGLRYAAPPVGKLRFLPPQPLAHWKEPADATRFGAAAIQAAGQPDMPADEIHSEDCLFLNVWTEAPDKAKRPVMVWLHGGAFSAGAPGRPTYDGRHFAKDGVVLVSVTHRLNVFGYAQLPDAWGPRYASSGLAGILDIVEALKWVRDNIERFGGDPENVTVFGESGGGAKVSLLLGMPAAKGLFHKAIIQSGAAIDAARRGYAQALGAALIDELGIKPGDVEALASIDTDTLFQAQRAAIDRVKDRAGKGFLVDGFVPSIDGAQLPRGPFTPDAPDVSSDIPLLIGTNKDESTLFMAGGPNFGKETDADFESAVRAAYPGRADLLIPALRAAYPGYSPSHLSISLASARMFWLDTLTLAERKLAQERAPVYMYLLKWETPINGGALKSTHALDLSLVFGTYESVRGFVGPGEEPATLSRQMHPAWVAFAKTGDPNVPGVLPSWPAYDVERRPVMIFDVKSHVENDPYRELRELMR